MTLQLSEVIQDAKSSPEKIEEVRQYIRHFKQDSTVLGEFIPKTKKIVVTLSHTMKQLYRFLPKIRYLKTPDIGMYLEVCGVILLEKYNHKRLDRVNELILEILAFITESDIYNYITSQQKNRNPNDDANKLEELKVIHEEIQNYQKKYQKIKTYMTKTANDIFDKIQLEKVLKVLKTCEKTILEKNKYRRIEKLLERVSDQTLRKISKTDLLDKVKKDNKVTFAVKEDTKITDELLESIKELSKLSDDENKLLSLTPTQEENIETVRRKFKKNEKDINEKFTYVEETNSWAPKTTLQRGVGFKAKPQEVPTMDSETSQKLFKQLTTYTLEDYKTLVDYMKLGKKQKNS
jgi:hypothetical protein